MPAWSPVALRVCGAAALVGLLAASALVWAPARRSRAPPEVDVDGVHATAGRRRLALAGALTSKATAVLVVPPTDLAGGAKKVYTVPFRNETQRLFACFAVRKRSFFWTDLTVDFSFWHDDADSVPATAPGRSLNRECLGDGPVNGNKCDGGGSKDSKMLGQAHITERWQPYSLYSTEADGDPWQVECTDFSKVFPTAFRGTHATVVVVSGNDADRFMLRVSTYDPRVRLNEIVTNNFMSDVSPQYIYRGPPVARSKDVFVRFDATDTVSTGDEDEVTLVFASARSAADARGSVDAGMTGGGTPCVVVPNTRMYEAAAAPRPSWAAQEVSDGIYFTVALKAPSALSGINYAAADVRVRATDGECVVESGGSTLAPRAHLVGGVAALAVLVSTRLGWSVVSVG